MGQKTHPKGFRLITTQKHLSEWYGSKLIYPSLIEEDFFIRQKINSSFAEFISISKIEINRINQNFENRTMGLTKFGAESAEVEMKKICAEIEKELNR